MNLERLLVAALALALASPPATADEISLIDAMTRARERARTVTAARSRELAAAERSRQASSMRLPKVSLHEIWMRTDSPADAFGLLLNQERFSLPEFASGDPNSPNATENALTRLEVSLPLYTGGELSSRIQQARLAAEATGDSASWVADSAALAAAAAYVQLAQIREHVGLLEHSLETVEAHAELARAFVEQGMLVRSELLRAEVEAARLSDLLTQARGRAEVAEANLSFQLAEGFSSDWQLEPLSDPLPLSEPLEEWLAGADTRRDLAAARKALEALELEVKVQRSGLLPKVGLVARRDLNDDDLFGSSGDSTAVLAMASIDLFGGGSHRAGAAAARAELAAARSEIEHFREAVRLSIKSSYEHAVSARERHRTAQAARAAASEAERITRERFEKGIAKTIDLLDAATARREADTRELVARSEAHLASLDLAVKAGRRPESLSISAHGFNDPSEGTARFE